MRLIDLPLNYRLGKDKRHRLKYYQTVALSEEEIRLFIKLLKQFKCNKRRANWNRKRNLMRSMTHAQENIKRKKSLTRKIEFAIMGVVSKLATSRVATFMGRWI